MPRRPCRVTKALPAVRLIPYSRLVATPWKNGGGETREIAACPDGAGFEDFDWRLSIATIAGDGAFSSFAGVDRILMLLSGDGVGLSLDGESETILAPGDLLAFAGERSVRSRLVGGAVQDLNVMVRRGRMTARMDVHTLDGPGVLDLGEDGGAITLRQGQAWTADGRPLGPGDTVLFEPGEGRRVTLTGAAQLVLIRFGRIRAAAAS